MKMKLVTALFVLSLGTTASFAQTGASDGSRFGHGEDSIRCLKNISIYTEYVKTNNFIVYKFSCCYLFASLHLLIHFPFHEPTFIEGEPDIDSQIVLFH